MIPCPPGGRSKVDLTLDLSSNDLRVAGAKAMASLLEMDTVRREGTWDALGTSWGREWLGYTGHSCEGEGR